MTQEVPRHVLDDGEVLRAEAGAESGEVAVIAASCGKARFPGRRRSDLSHTVSWAVLQMRRSTRP